MFLHSKRIKIIAILGIFILFMFIFMVFILYFNADENTSYLISSSNNKNLRSYDNRNYYVLQYANKTPDVTEATGGKGTGLNLLLINNIQTEGYVKELLELLVANQEGKLDNLRFHLPVEIVLGIQTNETGTYGGDSVPIPTSYLPYDEGAHKIVWGTQYGGFSSEELKLKGFTKNQRSIAKPYSGSYFGPFQIGADLGSSLKSKSLLNGYGMNDSRDWDVYFFPDYLSYLNNRVSLFYKNTLPITEDALITPDILAMTAIGIHNAGEAGFLYPAVAGIPYTESRRIKPIAQETKIYLENLTRISKDLRNSLDKSGLVAPRMESNSSRGLGAFLLCEAGWNLDDEGFHYLTDGRYFSRSSADYIAKLVWGNDKTADDLISYFTEKHKVIPISNQDCQNVYGMTSNTMIDSYLPGQKGHIYISRSETSTIYKNNMSDGSEPKLIQYLPIETLGQMTQAMLGGNYYYGAMLKYAGVGVDPTNPETYMQTYRENGEWTPSSETDWIQATGVDVSSLSPKVVKLLNEAKKWIGSSYGWGGKKPPIKNSSGGWLPPKFTGSYDTGGKKLYTDSFDCSGYTRYVYKIALDVEIGYGTYEQNTTSVLVTVPYSEAKTGDILLNGSISHVGIFLKDNGNGTALMMHSPQTGDVVKISNYSSKKCTIRHSPSADD